VKTPAKKATKTAAKPTAKVAAPARKVSAKSPVKSKTAAKTAKPVQAKAKPVSKPAAKAATPKPVVKKSLGKKAAARKAPTKPVPASKTAAKKASAKQVPVKKATPAKKPAVVKSAVVSKPAPPSGANSAALPLPVTKSPVSTAAASAQPTHTADLPARSSRPSARLAQITVPSMPQAVASTAAKASFLPQMTTTVLPVAAAPAKKDPKLANNWKNKPVEQLSDAEVLAMPDSEYMNDVQMAFFRLKLVQLKQSILNNAGETTEHLREDTVVVPDPADRATIEEEHALELRTRDRERKLLKKIEQSIARIDTGDYGYCDETGEPIGVGRLLARPTATLSLEAQQRRELKQKMFGD